MALVEERIDDGRVLALLLGHLRQGAMDAMREWTPEDGTPQGAVISPLLANLYLISGRPATGRVRGASPDSRTVPES